MKAYLVRHGVASEERIYLDHAGYSTYDGLYRLKHVLGQNRVIIVTQGYHLSRALMLARGKPTGGRVGRKSASSPIQTVISVNWRPAQGFAVTSRLSDATA